MAVIVIFGGDRHIWPLRPFFFFQGYLVYYNV